MFKKIFIPHKGNDYKPHIFRETAVAMMFAFTIATFIYCSILIPRILRSPQTAEIYSAVLEASANSDRQAAANLPPLAVNPVLVAAAQAKANDMATRGYFAHNTPEGFPPWYWISSAGYAYSYAGENLAIDFTDSSDVERAWMNSPGHRANILDTHYTEIGIALARGTYKGYPTTFVVEMFASPKALPNNVNLATVVSPKIQKAKPINQIITTTVTSSNTPTVESASITPRSTPTRALPVAPKPSLIEQISVNPSRTLSTIYLGLFFLIAISLILFIFIEWRIQHYKNIAYALLLLVIIGNLLFINWLMFSAPTVVV